MTANAFDSNGRPLVNSPAEALLKILADYDVYRIHATLSFSVERKRAVLEELQHTLAECKRATSASRAASQGGLATEWRQVAEFVQAQRDELQMWLLVNDGKMHAAWEMLISAQGAAYRAARWLPDFEPAQHLQSHLADVERVLFPKQTFLSPSMIIEESDIECSICKSRGNVCDHIAGEVYDGEVAANIIHRVSGVREVSFVDEPANKRCRALSYGGMDLLTGESVSSDVNEP